MNSKTLGEVRLDQEFADCLPVKQQGESTREMLKGIDTELGKQGNKR
jgi:hypothetical protein